RSASTSGARHRGQNLKSAVFTAFSRSSGRAPAPDQYRARLAATQTAARVTEMVDSSSRPLREAAERRFADREPRRTMIIDCHGHYTTAPKELGEYRERQKAELAKDPNHQAVKGTLDITDDQLRESVENNQLKMQRERGTDVTLFSPRASWMGHHIGNESTSRAWTEHCNDLIYRLTKLYPKNFVGVA